MSDTDVGDDTLPTTRGPASARASTRYRHPSDVARLILSLAVVAGLALVETLAPAGLLRATVDVLVLVNQLPDALADGLVGLVQLTATIAPVVVVGFLLRRRDLALLGIVAGAAGLAALSMALMSSRLDDTVPIDELGYDTVSSWFVGSQYPSATYIAALTAALVAASPWLRRPWRTGGWAFILAVVAARILSATEVPVRNAMLLAVGAAAGSAALVILGAPRRRVDTAAIRAVLERAGLPVTEITTATADPAADPRFAATARDGSALDVRVLGRDQRDTDLLFTLWRAMTVKGLGDTALVRSPHRALEREALSMGIFGSAGVTTPSPVAVLETPDEAAVLAAAAVPGRTLAELGDGISDAAARDLFRQLGLLQRRGLAHRSLGPANIVVDGDHGAFVELRRADLQADDPTLGADVAELLVAVALSVGTDRAIAAARAELTDDELRRGLPLLQPAVLTRATRHLLDGRDDGDALLERIRDDLADAVHTDHVELAPVQRITVGGAVSLVGSVVLVSYVFSLAADWDEIWDAFVDADLGYVVPVLVFALVPFLTGALSLQGAVPIELPFLRTTAVMFGQSFLNRFTPANAGGMAMRVRYLQLNGLDAPVAATSIGLTSAASGVAQGITIVTFLIWGGAADRFSDFEFPDIGAIVIVIVAVGLLVAGILATTWGRTVARPWIAAAFGQIRTTILTLARDPGKMARLLGGQLLGKLASILSFWLSVRAFDVDMSFPKAGALYIIASSIGSAVPTPGGVGGVEAALTAALLSYGVDQASAAGIVLFFRLMTFWFPTLPGYVFMRYVQRAGIA